MVILEGGRKEPTGKQSQAFISFNTRSWTFSSLTLPGKVMPADLVDAVKLLKI